MAQGMADPEALFVAHHHRVFKYLWRAVGHADAARDLTQEVCLRISRSRTAVNGDGAAWVFQIARNSSSTTGALVRGGRSPRQLSPT
jgi:DNA-directed RNA polymerase specialized sigma24 family protein